MWKLSLETMIKCQIQGRTENILLKYSRMGEAPGVTPETVTRPVRTQAGGLFWRNTVKARGKAKGRQEWVMEGWLRV